MESQVLKAVMDVNSSFSMMSYSRLHIIIVFKSARDSCLKEPIMLENRDF